MLQDFPWRIVIALIVIIVAVRSRLRWNRLRSEFRQLEDFADTLLQHGQGTILNIQGIISELEAGHPVRRSVEQALTRAERELSEMRELMQPHCSEQQQDYIE
jgi:hypothetical protein